MVKVAVMGFGTVGSGVVEVMQENYESIARSAAEPIEVKYILDVRDMPDNPYASKMIKDFSIIENDPEVGVVVETIGGVGVAFELTKRALLAGKSVVTSNKELVATRGHEIIALAKQKGANYLFEASVGGGIPIIRPITQCLAANEIDEVYGILNGTTNYILTEMIQSGASFEDALRQAQANGFAEKDPTADIEGIDAGRKICILSDLCFGRHIDPQEVPVKGITGVTLTDVEYARKIGYKIKLLGRAVRTEKGHATAYVAAHLIRTSSLLANVDGVMNGIVVHGNAIGEAMFYGAGAGKRPTASAVVADIIDAAKHFKSRKYLDWDEGFAGYVTDPEALESAWFIRCAASGAEVSAVFPDAEILGMEGEECMFTVKPMSGTALSAAADGLNVRAAYRVLD